MPAPRAKILVIDSAPADLMTLCAKLATEFDVQFASSCTQGMAHAMSLAPSLTLLADVIRSVEGEGACKQLVTQLTAQGQLARLL